MDIEGVALSSVQSYVREDRPVTPPLSFLLEAARVLDVRPAWLVIGEGAPTEAEQNALAAAAEPLLAAMRNTASTADDLVARLRSHSRHMDELVRETLGQARFGFWRLPDVARADVLDGFRQYVLLPRNLDEFADATPGESYPLLAQRFGEYLSAPLVALGITVDALEQVEHVMLVETQLRAVKVATWATSTVGDPDAKA
ncbi:MAG: hypothetical protein ABL963_12230 [Longimicrobiales bacterium]